MKSKQDTSICCQRVSKVYAAIVTIQSRVDGQCECGLWTEDLGWLGLAVTIYIIQAGMAKWKL